MNVMPLEVVGVFIIHPNVYGCPEQYLTYRELIIGLNIPCNRCSVLNGIMTMCVNMYTVISLNGIG